MASSGMLRSVYFVRIDDSEELSASIIRMTKIDELRTTLPVNINFVFLRRMHRLIVTANDAPSSLILVTLMMKALSSSETSVLTRGKRRNIPEDGITKTL
jgi:hypothetical protein